MEVTLQSHFDGVHHVIEAIEIAHICEVLVEVPKDHEFIKGPQNCSQPLADGLRFPSFHQDISLLIGSYQLWRILGKGITWDEKHKGLLSIEIVLGWTFQGPVNGDEPVHTHTQAYVCVLTNCCMSDEGVTLELQRFWQLESLGIRCH